MRRAARWIAKGKDTGRGTKTVVIRKMVDEPYMREQLGRHWLTTTRLGHGIEVEWKEPTETVQ